jgi:hypothetical protein
VRVSEIKSEDQRVDSRAYTSGLDKLEVKRLVRRRLNLATEGSTGNSRLLARLQTYAISHRRTHHASASATNQSVSSRRIRQRHIPNSHTLLLPNIALFILVNHIDRLIPKAALTLHRDEHPAGTLQLVEQLRVKNLGRGTHVYGIVRSALRVALPSISTHKLHSTLLQHGAAVLAFRHVVPRQVDQRLDVIDAHDLGARWDFVFFVRGTGDEVGEDVGEVAGAGADVEDAGGRVQEGEERFAGGGVHVGGGDGGVVTDGLGGVFVGGGRLGAVMGAVDLWWW